MTAGLALACAVFGLCVGSFLNVVIHRVPKRESVVRPRSHCPACGAQIAERDNVPVVSWLLLHGRCRACDERIPLRYPLVEVGTAVLFAAAAVRFGASWQLPAFCIFFASLLAVSVIDLDLYIIPNRVVYPTLFITAPLLAVAAAAEGTWGQLRNAAIGGAVGFGLLLVIHVAMPRGMGFGDVRLAGVIGMMLGWLGLGYLFLGLFLAFLLAAVIGIVLIATRLRTRKDAVPFGPFLAMGAVLAALWGHAILRAYRGHG
ncbi:MAG TPA: prepilin peptidase [Acidimicrobiales bacterium]|nr:prepilin peptidase [Acidimicrobiales bacterium]